MQRASFGKNFLEIVLMLALVATLSSCSSSSKEEGAEGEEGDEFAMGEEGGDTDFVPEGDGELEDLDDSLLSDSAEMGEEVGKEDFASSEEEKSEGDALDGALDGDLDDSLLAEETPPTPPADDLAQGSATTDSSLEESFAPPTADPSFSEPVGSGSLSSYSIKRGDTLMKIAFETYGDVYQWRKIYNMNRDRIQNPNSISVGSNLQVEQPATPVQIERNGQAYEVKVGDTLGTISRDVYGTPTKWRRIWDNNKQLIKNPNKIYAGFYVYYTMTPEDEAEKQRFIQDTPNPLAGGASGSGSVAPPPIPGAEDGAAPSFEAPQVEVPEEQRVPSGDFEQPAIGDE